jgi:hypothetical protein
VSVKIRQVTISDTEDGRSAQVEIVTANGDSLATHVFTGQVTTSYSATSGGHASISLSVNPVHKL